MKLWEFAHKYVKIVDIDNKEWQGYCIGYTQPLDNENNVASITVDTIEGGICFYENEIKSIEEIEEQ